MSQDLGTFRTEPNIGYGMLGSEVGTPISTLAGQEVKQMSIPKPLHVPIVLSEQSSEKHAKQRQNQ